MTLDLDTATTIIKTLLLHRSPCKVTSTHKSIILLYNADTDQEITIVIFKEDNSSYHVCLNINSDQGSVFWHDTHYVFECFYEMAIEKLRSSSSI